LILNAVSRNARVDTLSGANLAGSSDYRIFYDVSNEEAIVYVRAVRKKPPSRKTEDIL
jgi:hypothetical protein